MKSRVQWARGEGGEVTAIDRGIAGGPSGKVRQAQENYGSRFHSLVQTSQSRDFHTIESKSGTWFQWMKECKSIEAMNSHRMHMVPDAEVRSQLRMSHSPDSSMRRNRIWKLFQLMREYKLTEVIDNDEMPIYRELKAGNPVRMSHSKDPSIYRNRTRREFEWMTEYKKIEGMNKSEMQIRQGSKVWTRIPVPNMTVWRSC
jgi:hypothetical protein